MSCVVLWLVPDWQLSIWVITFINVVAVSAMLKAFDRGVACGGGDFGAHKPKESLCERTENEMRDGPGEFFLGNLIQPGTTIPMVRPGMFGFDSEMISSSGVAGIAAFPNDASSDGRSSVSGAGSRDEISEYRPPFPSFSAGDKESFKLRTIGYKRHGRKAASASPLYELVALDVFKTPYRLDEIFKHVNIDSFDLPDTAHPDVPPMLLMNLQFPREKQDFMTDGDGPGASVVMYFKITEATLASVQNESKAERSRALNLFIEWCRLAPDDPIIRGRFKAMGFINNIKDFGIPAIAANYNGKPVLIKKTGTMFRGANFIEMDINIHRFSYICRSTLINMKEKFGQMIIRCGFTIEGRDDDELPEVLLGCANLNGVNLDAAIDLESL